MISTRKFLKEVRRSDATAREVSGVVIQVDPLAVQFDGEPGAEELDLPRLGSYAPSVGDRVLLLRDGATWVVAGRLGVGLAGARVPPGTLVAKVRHTPGGTVGTSTSAIGLGIVDYDPYGTLDAANNLVVPPWAGMWTVSGQVNISGGGTNRIFVAVRKNGTGTDTASIIGGSEGVGGSSGSRSKQAQATVPMNGTTDFFTLCALCNPSSTTTTSFGGSWLEIHYAGPDMSDEEPVE